MGACPENVKIRLIYPLEPLPPQSDFQGKKFSGKIFALSVDWTVHFRNKRCTFATFLKASKRVEKRAN